MTSPFEDEPRGISLIFLRSVKHCGRHIRVELVLVLFQRRSLERRTRERLLLCYAIPAYETHRWNWKTVPYNWVCVH